MPSADTPSAKNRRREAAAAARAQRRERFMALFPASHLALTGMVLSVAFLFQERLAVKLVFLVLFIAASWLAGRRFSLPATLIVSATIVGATLFVPFGKVLFTLGPLKITEGALLDGIDKAVTFEGLLYISKASIVPTLRLPGRFGAVVAKAFLYYDRIVENRVKIRPSHLMEDADSLMLDIWASGDVTAESVQESVSTGAGAADSPVGSAGGPGIPGKAADAIGAGTTVVAKPVTGRSGAGSPAMTQQAKAGTGTPARFSAIILMVVALIALATLLIP